MNNKAIEKAQRDARELEKEYPGSSVVWMGDNKYLIVKNGEVIRI